MKKVFILLLTLLSLTGCSNKKFEKNLFYMDTYINIKLYTTEQKANEAFIELDKLYSKYHNMTDIYNEKSEISKVNNSSEDYIKVSNELLEILKLGETWQSKSNGYFNINIGNLTKYWKDYKELNKIPPKEELDKIKINNFKIEKNKVLNNNINFDLGGIAKGYVTSIAEEILLENNIENYLISAGGNILAGKSYDKEYFSIGIEDPTKKGEIYKVIKGNNISVVTSGGYERFFEVDNKRYHHIIDPKTKYPSNSMLSATIVTKNDKIADILSTTVFLMDKEKAIDLIESIPDTECILYISKDEIIKSSGFSKYE